MKLHLPKSLLVAVLAACVAPVAWGTNSGWGDPNGNISGKILYMGGRGTSGTSHTGITGIGENDTVSNTSIDTADFTQMYDDTNKTLTIAADCPDSTSMVASIGELTIYNGSTLNVNTSGWGTGRTFSTLTIGALIIKDNGQTALGIGGGTADNKQNVVIESISGTISALSVASHGKLTLGAGLNEAKDNRVTFTVGGNNSTNLNASGELVVASNATLQFAGYDVIKHDQTGQTITLNGGTWEANGTRQSLGGNFTINLINGTIQNTTGRDGGANGSKYGVVDIANSGAKIVSSGTSSITGGIRLRGNDLTIKVAQGDTLSVDSFYGQDNTSGGIVKQGDGTLKITTMAANAAGEAFYTGNTTMEAGTIEYALASGTGSYTGTISGTGNVAKSGAGSVTLANVSNLEGNISVTGGALTIASLSNLEGNLSITGGTLTITSLSNLEGNLSITGGALDITSLSTDKTMNVSVSSGSLSIGSVVVNPDTMELTAKEGATVTQYYSMDGGTTQNSEGNGFLYTSGDYVLFNGYVWNGSLDNGLTVSSDGTNTYVTANTVGTTYYLSTITADINATEIGADTYAVRGGTMNIVGTMNSSDIQYTSGGVTLANADSTLVLDSADNAATLLATTTGEAGKIKVAVDTTLQSASTQAEGNLTINKDKTLQVGTGNSATTNISSFSSVTLDGGTLFLKGASQTVHALTVEQAATLKVSNWGAAIQTYTLDNLTTLNANLTITSESNEKGKVVINELTGSKDIFVSGGNANNGPVGLTIKKLTDYTGTINVDGGNRDANQNYVTITSEGDISLKGLNLTNKGLADLSGVVGTKNLGTVVIDASSSLALSGAIGNMAASGAGTLSMAAGTTTSGTVSIANALTIGGTIANTGSFTLSGNVTIADIHALKNNTIYSDNEGKDGYISSGIYYVVESSGSGSATASEGLLLNGTHTLTAENGNLVARVENETPGGIYYVNTRDFTVDGTNTNAAKDATGYYIAADKTLTLAGNQSDSMTAGKILSEATGEGNIELNTTASYSGGVASQVEGKLTINNGVVLNVGNGSGDSSNIASFSSVELKGGALSLNGAGSEVKSLTVSDAKSTLTIKNANSGHQTYTLSGTTTLKADLDITSPDEHGNVIVKNLTGNKNLSVVGGNGTWGCTMVRLEKLTDYTGIITVDNEGRGEATPPAGVTVEHKYTNIEFGTSGGEAAFSTLKGLEIKGNAYAMVYAKGESTIESLTLANGTLNYKTNYGRHTYTLDKVEVKGSGTIAINSDNTHYEGEVTIKNLKNAEGETSGELTLSSNFRDNQANVFNLEDGDFSGKIVFESLSSVGDGTKRLHALNLKDGAVASKAVINVEDTNNSSHMGIAVGADKVIVKGIAGTAQNVAIYSGVQAFKATSFASDGTNRTLEIATNGESYTTSAAIKENVNLVKSGEGSQTFTGTVASSSVSVLGGGLSLTGIETLQLHDLVVKSGATLSVGANNNGVVMVGSPVAPASTTVSTPSAKLEGGATINGSLNLSNASSLTLDGIAENSVVSIVGDLILPEASKTPTLTLSGGILNSLAAMNLGETLGIFSVHGGFFVGNQVTDALDATNGIALNTVFSASGDNNFEGYYLGFIPGTDEAGYSTVYIGKIVPEPTTATLSLLALAALAARRRRR